MRNVSLFGKKPSNDFFRIHSFFPFTCKMLMSAESDFECYKKKYTQIKLLGKL